MNWDEWFIRQAMLVSEKSKDPSTKVGCVIVGPDNAVLSVGFNGFPRGVVETVDDVFKRARALGRDLAIWTDSIPPRPYPTNPVFGEEGNKIHQKNVEIMRQKVAERWDRPAKYSRIEHAERNAIYNAARNGIRLLGARAYLNWEPVPCADCARALIQAGIVEVIGPDIPFKGAGSGVNYHLDFTASMFDEAGVRQRRVKLDQKNPE